MNNRISLCFQGGYKNRQYELLSYVDLILNPSGPTLVEVYRKVVRSKKDAEMIETGLISSVTVTNILSQGAWKDDETKKSKEKSPFRCTSRYWFFITVISFEHYPEEGATAGERFDHEFVQDGRRTIHYLGRKKYGSNDPLIK